MTVEAGELMMANEMRIAIGCFGTLILLLMHCNFGAQITPKKETDDMLFTCMLFTNMALLLTDMSMWLLDGTQFIGARALYMLVTVIYFSLHPVICLFWLLYCEEKINKSWDTSKRRMPLYCLPLLLMLIGTVMSCSASLFFQIDAQNIYHRGRSYNAFVILCAVYFIYTYFITLNALKNGKSDCSGRDLKALLIYPLFPGIGAVCQSLYFGLPVIWIGSVISLLIIYFNLQNAQITTDALTGINNRRRFEEYLCKIIAEPCDSAVRFLLLLDIDRFKAINDTYGHLTGDDALRAFAAVLIQSVLRKDFIARIGGDEFVIIGERDCSEHVYSTIAQIGDNLVAFNEREQKPYRLSASIGCAMLRQNEKKTVDELIMEADQQMYKEKQRVRL